MKKILEFFLGMGIIFLVLNLSIFLIKFLKISFPAPILGIIMLFIFLKTGIVKEKYIKSFCDFILKYMILFFIPMFVGIINYKDILSKNLVPVILTIFITTSLVIIFVGLFVENAIKFKRLKNFRRIQNL